jgi:hypothetical protein
MPDSPFVFFAAAIAVLLIAAWAGWQVGGRRASKPKILPDRVWLCDNCKSFNDPTHLTCYRCHQPRADDARFVEPDPDFHVTQQLGRPKGSTILGASSPWLAGEEPLRDAWLSEHARPAEQALAESEPAAPAFWTAGADDDAPLGAAGDEADPSHPDSPPQSPPSG